MKLLITCKQASQIISQSLDSPLPWSYRMQLKLHLFICRFCARFSRQMRLLRTAVQRIQHDTENDQSIQLSSDAKARISQAVTSTN